MPNLSSKPTNISKSLFKTRPSKNTQGVLLDFASAHSVRMEPAHYSPNRGIEKITPYVVPMGDDGLSTRHQRGKVSCLQGGEEIAVQNTRLAEVEETLAESY